MSDEKNILTIKILDRSYQVKCSPEEARELEIATHYLEQQMRQIQQTSHDNIERLTIITALNITHELLHLTKRLQELQQYIQKFLATATEVAV